MSDKGGRDSDLDNPSLESYTAPYTNYGHNLARVVTAIMEEVHINTGNRQAQLEQEAPVAERGTVGKRPVA